jgi:WD40 repeat protein
MGCSDTRVKQEESVKIKVQKPDQSNDISCEPINNTDNSNNALNFNKNKKGKNNAIKDDNNKIDDAKNIPETKRDDINQIDINIDTKEKIEPLNKSEAPNVFKTNDKNKKIEGFYSKYDINNDYYLFCPDCKDKIPYIEKVAYNEDVDDFNIKYKCNCSNESDNSPLNQMISTEKPKNLCEKHNKEQLILFCKICRKTFCKLCNKQHKNHVKEKFISKENGESIINIVNEKKDKIKGIEIINKIIENLLKDDEISEILNMEDVEDNISDISFEDNTKEERQKGDKEYICSNTIKGHEDKVVSLVILRSGYVATGSYDSTVRIWDIEQGACVKIIQEIGSVICLLEFESFKLLTGTSECNIGLWDINDDKEEEICNFLGHQLWVNCLEKCDDNYFASGSNDSTIIIWDYNERKDIKTIKAHDDCVLCLIKLKNGNLCSGSADFYIKIWDWKNGVCLSSIKAHENWVKCLCQFDDDILLSGSDDRTIKIWKNEQCMATLNGHINSIRALCKIDDNFFASGSFDNNINIWDYKKQMIVQVLKGHTSNVTCLAKFKKNSLISCSTDYTIKLWEEQK